MTPTNHARSEIPAYLVITERPVQPIQYLVTLCGHGGACAIRAAYAIRVYIYKDMTI